MLQAMTTLSRPPDSSVQTSGERLREVTAEKWPLSTAGRQGRGGGRQGKAGGWVGRVGMQVAAPQQRQRQQHHQVLAACKVEAPQQTGSRRGRACQQQVGPSAPAAHDLVTRSHTLTSASSPPLTSISCLGWKTTRSTTPLQVGRQARDAGKRNKEGLRQRDGLRAQQEHDAHEQVHTPA